MRRARWLCALAAMLILWTAAAQAVTLPSDTMAIEEEAFLGAALTEVTLPDNLRVIGARAFSTSSLRHITIPASVTSIDKTAFSGTAADFFATVVKGSYAETWCKQNGVRYSYTDVWYQVPSVTALAVAQAGPKYWGTPYSAMDCQAFVEACLKDAGLSLNLAGSNAWFRQVYRNGWVGTPEQCRAKFGFIPKGAFLFILEPHGGEPAIYWADGLGNASHMGIYTGVYTNGQKGAMASSKSKGGVIYSAFSGSTINGGWNMVGLWNRLDYGDDAINKYLATH